MTSSSAEASVELALEVTGTFLESVSVSLLLDVSAGVVVVVAVSAGNASA